MNQLILLRPLALVTETLLVIPSFYLIVSASLNDVFEVPGLFKIIKPIFENTEYKSRGLNLDMLILLGPLPAIIINLPQVIHLHFSKGHDQLYIYFTLLRYRYSCIVVAIATIYLAVLFFYLLHKKFYCTKPSYLTHNST